MQVRLRGDIIARTDSDTIIAYEAIVRRGEREAASYAGRAHKRAVGKQDGWNRWANRRRAAVPQAPFLS